VSPFCETVFLKSGAKQRPEAQGKLVGMLTRAENGVKMKEIYQDVIAATYRNHL
jgi:hypothetical protein